MPTVTIFGSGNSKPDTEEYKNALLLGKLLAEQNFDIATGGYKGIMEAALKGASDFNAKRYAIIYPEYNDKPNQYYNQLIKADSYLERSNKLIDIADAYVVFPGSTGTLLELATIWALKDRDILKNKPLITFGEQWNEVIQIMSFYSETVLDKLDLISNYNKPKEIVQEIIEILS